MATKKIDVYGLSIEVPEEQAPAFIAARDAEKEDRRKTADRLGALEAEAKSALEKEKKATDAAELEKLKNKGEYDKALEIEKKASSERSAKLAAKFRDAEVRRLIAANPKMQAVEDAPTRSALADLFASQLTSSCRFDTEKELLEVLAPGGAVALNNEGKPKQADAWVSEILDASPLLKPKASPGSGAGGQGGKQETKPTATQADLDNRSPMEKAKFFEQGGVIAG